MIASELLNKSTRVNWASTTTSRQIVEKRVKEKNISKLNSNLKGEMFLFFLKSGLEASTKAGTDNLF